MEVQEAGGPTGGREAREGSSRKGGGAEARGGAEGLGGSWAGPLFTGGNCWGHTAAQGLRASPT